MWIPIVVIVLTIALALGPVMWLRPSASERRLAKFRAYAIKLGLRVRLVASKDLNRTIAEKGSSVAFYQLPWDMSVANEKTLSRENKQLNQWQLVNGNLEHEIHFDHTWNWQSSRPPASLAFTNLRQIVAGLPKTIVAVECSPQGMAIGWWETGDLAQVDSIYEILQKLKLAYVEDIEPLLNPEPEPETEIETEQKPEQS